MKLATRAYELLLGWSFTLAMLCPAFSFGQCTNNNTAIAGGAITPACPGTTNVPCVQGGQYALVAVTTGNIYTFAVCAATFDTQITLFNNAGGVSLGYNDDFCGLQSQVTWTATFTGQLRVLVDLYNCATNAVCAPMVITCTLPPPVPANDNPCGATPLPVNGTCVYSNSTTAGATATAGVPAPGCANYLGGDVWFSVVVPPSGNLTIDSNTGVVTDGGMALYTATACNGTFTLVECDDDDSPNGLMPSITRTGLTPGATVYVRFWEFGNDNNGTFTICATQPPPPPANDNPCGATALPVNTTCNYSTGTTANSTATLGPLTPTCAFYNGFDVWFTAVVPASGSLILETNTGVVTDGGMAVYTAASCAGPFTEIACDDDSGPGLMPALNFSGLAAGSTVYIRFWEFGGDNNGTFSICARTPPPPPAGDCVYVLNLFDSFGDGWGTSNVGISVNGGAFTYYTVGGTTNQILLGMYVGQVLVVSYNNSGASQGENSYSIGYSGGGTYFNSGSPPASGISFTQTVNCQPPPAAPQDCAGGTTVCGGQAFNNNSTNTGNVVDLNTANQGCLASGERQGTWYYFSPSAAGNIGFTISPAIPTDYDFAVWGPMTSVTCPPSGPPYRCSYAAPVGDTGAGNGATDTSEGVFGDRWVSTFNVIAGQIYILYVDNFSTNGQAFDLSWQLTNGASLDCSVLAVGEVTLKATQLGSDVLVDWSTTFERGSSHFGIERSLDGEHFNEVGTRSAAGRSDQLTAYTFLDATAAAGLNYYRIRSVGTDGVSQYSPTVGVLITRGKGPFVVPNPVEENAVLYLDATVGGSLFMQINDASGRVVQNRRVVLPEGSQRIDLELRGLDAGSYHLRLMTAAGKSLGQAHFIRH